jgi:hypothetical protein
MKLSICGLKKTRFVGKMILQPGCGDRGFKARAHYRVGSKKGVHRLETPLALTDWKVCPPPLSADAIHDANALASKAPPAPKKSAAATH